MKSFEIYSRIFSAKNCKLNGRNWYEIAILTMVFCFLIYLVCYPLIGHLGIDRPIFFLADTSIFL